MDWMPFRSRSICETKGEKERWREWWEAQKSADNAMLLCAMCIPNCDWDFFEIELTDVGQIYRKNHSTLTYALQF